ncbi:hypothetical protein MABM_32620 [Mycobacteroides abscessus]|nr:hypothetical protein MABM_32620 [Mycobacteroides abscessus]
MLTIPPQVGGGRDQSPQRIGDETFRGVQEVPQRGHTATVWLTCGQSYGDLLVILGVVGNARIRIT